MRLIAALLILTCSFAQPAVPETLPSDLVRLEVLTGWRSAERRHLAGLRLTLAPGWKTYWRSPGAAGLAPIFDFSASTGITAAEPRWPVPVVFDFNGMRSIGYHDAVTIPLDLTLDGRPARLAGEIDIGVCDEVCVPVSLDFSVDLPPEGDRDPMIVAALVDRPQTSEEAGASARCAVEFEPDRLGLTLHLALIPLGSAEVVVIESEDPSLWISEAVSTRVGGTLMATAEALARDGGTPTLDRSRLRITVLSEGQAVEFQGCQAA